MHVSGQICRAITLMWIKTLDIKNSNFPKDHSQYSPLSVAAHRVAEPFQSQAWGSQRVGYLEQCDIHNLPITQHLSILESIWQLTEVIKLRTSLRLSISNNLSAPSPSCPIANQVVSNTDCSHLTLALIISLLPGFMRHHMLQKN